MPTNLAEFSGRGDSWLFLLTEWRGSKAVREITNLSETNKLNQEVKLKPLNYKYKFYQNIVRLILHFIA